MSGDGEPADGGPLAVAADATSIQNPPAEPAPATAPAVDSTVRVAAPPSDIPAPAAEKPPVEQTAAKQPAAKRAAASKGADPLDAAAIDDAVTRAAAEAADQGIQQSVVVLDRSDGQSVAAVDPDAEVPSMSLVKLFIAADLLTSAGGADNLDAGTLHRLSTMIETSDDSIASDLYSTDGAGAIIDRTVEKYGLSGTRRADNPRYWGDVQVTAEDLARFLDRALADPATGPFLTSTMAETTDTAADGFDQNFGMNAIDGAGSKQGWGCCLSGVVAIHSVGFTGDRIVVVLSTSSPDADGLNTGEAATATADPGTMAAVRSVSVTARAALA